MGPINSLAIRGPLPADAVAISDCIRSSTTGQQMTDGSQQGIADRHDLSGPEEILARIDSGECSLLACRDDLVVAYIAYKRTNHLSLLFVRKEYQGMGIGRQLIERTRTRFSEVTVNATDVAVGFYEKMGFAMSGDRFLKRGAWSTPMLWSNKARHEGLARSAVDGGC